MSGGAWVAGSDSNSAARLNQKTFTQDTGANLAALTTYPGMPVYCTSTGSGFTIDTFYIRNAANSAWTSYSPQSIHDHSAATAAAGGLLLNVMGDNTGQFVYQNDLLSPRASELRQTLCSAGATVTDVNTAGQWSVKCDTAATTSNLAQGDLGGLGVDFGSPLKFQAKIGQATATTNVQARIGINVESGSAAPITTQKMLGFEFCDSAGADYFVVSGDGTTRSTTDTLHAFNSIHSLKLTYTPSTNVIGQIDATTATTKTTNLPNSGASDADKVMRFGIQTKTTTTQDLSIYAAVICYVPNDTWTV